MGIYDDVYLALHEAGVRFVVLGGTAGLTSSSHRDAAPGGRARDLDDIAVLESLDDG